MWTDAPYCESEKVVRNESKILYTSLMELHQERFEMKLYKQAVSVRNA